MHIHLTNNQYPGLRIMYKQNKHKLLLRKTCANICCQLTEESPNQQHTRSMYDVRTTEYMQRVIEAFSAYMYAQYTSSRNMCPSNISIYVS